MPTRRGGPCVARDEALFESGSPYIGSDRLKTQSGLLTYVYRLEVEDSEEPTVDQVILIEGGEALTPWQGEDS